MSLITFLDAEELLELADEIDTYADAVRELLPGELNGTVLATSNQLRALAEVKLAYDEEQARILAEQLAAEAAAKAAYEAKVSALLPSLTLVGSKRKSAVKLLEQFDITPKTELV